MLQELDKTRGRTRSAQVWGRRRACCAPLARWFFYEAVWRGGFLTTGVLLLLLAACFKSSSELLCGEGEVGNSFLRILHAVRGCPCPGGSLVLMQNAAAGFRAGGAGAGVAGGETPARHGAVRGRTAEGKGTWRKMPLRGLSRLCRQNQRGRVLLQLVKRGLLALRNMVKAGLLLCCRNGVSREARGPVGAAAWGAGGSFCPL